MRPANLEATKKMSPFPVFSSLTFAAKIAEVLAQLGQLHAFPRCTCCRREKRDAALGFCDEVGCRNAVQTLPICSGKTSVRLMRLPPRG